jgi:hypothetical protein
MESDLYPPVKALLEGQGYSVKGEVRGCDVVGVKDGATVIVELKKAFGLALVLQGVNRLALSDTVYLAVGAWPKKIRDVRKLCRRLGLGLLVVLKERCEVALDPMPYKVPPRKNARKLKRMLGEHERRVGDPNRGGQSTRVPMMTAYRQEALRCAGQLARNGAMAIKDVRAKAEAPNAGRILFHDHYGWFERVERGVYALTPKGQKSWAQHARAAAVVSITQAASTGAASTGAASTGAASTGAASTGAASTGVASSAVMVGEPATGRRARAKPAPVKAGSRSGAVPAA